MPDNIQIVYTLLAHHYGLGKQVPFQNRHIDTYNIEKKQ